MREPSTKTTWQHPAAPIAFLETQPERRTELASIADDFEGLIGTFDRTNGRLWAVQQPGWTPDGAETKGGE